MSLWQVQSQNFRIGSRLAYLAAGIAAFVASYSAGAFGVQLTAEEAQTTVDEFTASVEDIEEGGIFSNNVLIALGMFIPAAGVGLGMYAGVSTGIVFNAFVHVVPNLAGVSPLSVFATPFGILELFAYGLGISRSGILTYDLIKRRPWRQYLVMTLIEIAIAIAALLIGSYVEGQFIENAQ